ncbi:hypothetical protein [Actinopolymorpha cephalotaxi]|uniref:Halobacterial output domain-containing protein n=1 Tax=Actinopolymorpha cephalotaxi TaxID=504797 RepID=A0ABX2S5H1_9ACTN|nr:hypothetical protein [Actinopolymorpha cephalotaxi]NYH83562.1 hypothetical protein [Actinopolymorpha cephalotaxi]
MHDDEGCPTCGWPVAELTDPTDLNDLADLNDPNDLADRGGAGELLSRHRTSAGTVTYVRCVCGGVLVLVADAVVGGAGSWPSEPSEPSERGPAHRGTPATRGTPS